MRYVIEVRWRILKYDFDDRDYQRYLERPDLFRPKEILECGKNLVVNGGLDLAAQLLIGTSGLKALDNTNANIGVGDSNTAPSATDTDLLGTNKAWKGMKTGFPSFTSVGQLKFESDFGSTEALFDWKEIGLANGPNPPTDTLFGRLTGSFGNHSGGTWTVQATVTFKSA